MSYHRMQRRAVAHWQRRLYRAGRLGHDHPDWRIVFRRLPVRRRFWRFDAIGGYSYQHGYCVRDAFRQHFGDTWPHLAELPRSVDLRGVAAFCARHTIRFLHGAWEVTIFDGDAVVWFLAAPRDEEAGHAVFCRDPLAIIQSGQQVVAVALLDGRSALAAAC